MPGRTLAIGDIHGCATALERLLQVVDPAELDTVVLLGDLVDKGPDTRRAVQLILDLRPRVAELVVVKGNHDEHLLSAIDSWRQGVGDWQGLEQFETYRSYGSVEGIPEEHIAFLRAAVDYHETTDHVFVHASLAPGVPLEQQGPAWLRYRYLSPDARPLASGKRVICGHLPQSTGRPWVLDGWVCIDTAAFRGGWLTCLDIHTDQVWQASETGEVRQGDLKALGRRSEW